MKHALFIPIFLLSLMLPLLSESDIRLLRIQEPAKGLKQRYHLFVNIQDLQLILKDPTLDLKEGETQIRLYGTDGRKLAKLGIVKKGRIKWLFRQWKKTMLCVKMDPIQARKLLDEARTKRKRTGYQLGLTQEQKDSDRLKVVKCYGLVFHPHVDLYGVLVYPLQAAPGQDIGSKVSLTIFNEGSIAANNFFVDLILAKKTEIQVTPGIPSKDFRDGMLLGNGRLEVNTLAPGESITLHFKNPMVIPGNTPPGKYSLAAILDPDHKIEETQEKNNCISRLIFITKNPKKSLTQSSDKPIDLRTKKKGKGSN